MCNADTTYVTLDILQCDFRNVIRIYQRQLACWAVVSASIQDTGRCHNHLWRNISGSSYLPLEST